jgi:hypothetical protein
MRILTTHTDQDHEAATEAGAPPHAERPTAAPSTNPERTRRRPRRRAVALATAVAGIAVLGAACGFSPAPAPAPAPAGNGEAAIREVFGPLGVADKAVSVASCESGLNPMAGYPNATYKGLFQLGPSIVAINAYGGDYFDAWQNAQAARDVYLSRGNWSAWPVCGR